jgi:hypothetical protein
MQVTVWFVRDGPQEQRGSSAYDEALETCVDRLGLRREQWIANLEKSPRFGDQSKPRSIFDPYRHVVCKIDDAEAKSTNWKAGYYRIALSPEEVIAILGPPKEPWN